jgi:hypothetical protein
VTKLSVFTANFHDSIAEVNWKEPEYQPCRNWIRKLRCTLRAAENDDAANGTYMSKSLLDKTAISAFQPTILTS